MSGSIFSPSWYRVAGLIPRLRSHALIHRQVYRGQVSYLLQDRLSGRFHRFSPAAHAMIGMMDGRRTIDQIWHGAGERLGDDLPTQDETIRLLGQLYHANALVTDAPPDVAELAFRGGRVRERQRWERIKSPLALRLPLIDPDRLLERAMPFVRPLFGTAGLALWLAVVGAGVVLAARHWAQLSTGVADRVLAAENLFLLWILFPLVKVMHELGHAFATRRWGGEVHEMGVMLLVGIPVPYVAATAATAFQDRWRRALVGAAGVVVELFIAALALFVWAAAEPGLTRAVAFNVIVIASVSSLVFNGNPFLRFDAYYVLSDVLEIPNLGQRANQYLGYWIQRHAFGVEDTRSPANDRREALWLASYAIASFFARLLVMLSIALFVATKLFALGVLLAGWSVFQFTLLPLQRQIRFLLLDGSLRDQRARAIGITVLVLGGLLAVAFLLPVQSWTRSEGVVWAPEHSHVRVETDGYVRDVLVRGGERVAAGQPLFVLEDPDLEHERDAAAASLRASRARYAEERTRDRVQAAISRQAIEQAERTLARVEERLAGLTVRSPGDGELLMDPTQDLQGRFVRRGEVLAYVTDFAPLQVRVAVPAASVDWVRSRTRAVEVRLAESVERVYAARLVAAVPLATHQLPSLALAIEGGGEIALDPMRGEEGQAFQKHFLFDLAIEGAPRPQGIGERVFVRFEHEPETVAVQAWRGLRRLFLSLFQV